MARFSTVPLEEATGVDWSDPEARQEYYRQRYRRDPKRQVEWNRASLKRMGRVQKMASLTKEDAAWVTEYGDGNFNEGVRRLIAAVRATREEGTA